MSSNSKKNWERAWSTEEIVNQADSWNLACDAALLNTLQAFGDRVLNISEEVHTKVDRLCNSLNQISLRVDLVRNEFNSLRNSQFVECRVYEEDEILLTKQEKEQKAQYDVPKDETMEDLKKAVNLGLQILDEYYDKVEVPVSDSEEDDEVDVPSYVYRRKDPYLHRHLPYVIGSEEWHKKWHVGLEESSDSEIEKSASDKFSDSDIDDNFEIKDQSDVSSELSATDISKGRPAVVPTANTTQQNNFYLPTEGSNSTSNDIPKMLSFAEQLVVKLGNVIKEKEGLLEEPEVNRRPIKKRPGDYGALFSDEPPPLDDNVIKEQESQGIFSGGKGLFDDEDDDNDKLCSYGKPKDTSSTDYLGSSKTGQTVQSKGLFDEDSDDDIFSQNSINNRMKQPYLQNLKPAVPLFDAEPPILETEYGIQERKKPVGGVSVFAKTDLFQIQKLENLLKQRKVSASDESNDDIPSPNNTKEKYFESANEESRYSNNPIISNVPELTTKIEDNLPHKNSNHLCKDVKPAALGTLTPTTKPSSFFDDIFGDDLFSDTNKKFSSNLFSEEDFFPEKYKIKPSEPDKQSSDSVSSVTAIEERSGGSKYKLFEEKQSDIKNEYDYSWRDTSKNKIGSIFEDTDEDEFDTFVSKKSNIGNAQNNKKILQTTDRKTEKEAVQDKGKKNNLFDDEYDDERDLFTKIFNERLTEKGYHSKLSTEEMFHPKKLQRKPDIVRNPVKVEVAVSKELDVHPESTTLQKEKLNNSCLSKKKSSDLSPSRVQLMTGKPIDETQGDNSLLIVDKIQEKTEDTTQEDCSWKNSSKTDKMHRVEDISQEQNLYTGNKSSELDTSTKSKPANVTKTSIAHTRSVMNIPQVNFMDSIPPPVVGWDNTSDNIFDDMEPYGNDDFQSQSSSLFDSEPPLFFNDTSGIVEGVLENRFDSVNSFDPSITSSRRLSSDVFSNTSNDSVSVSDKILEGITILNTPNLQCVSELSAFSSENNTDSTPSGNPDDLYSSVTVNPTDESIFESSERKRSDRLLPVNIEISEKLSDLLVQEFFPEHKIDSGTCDAEYYQKRTSEDLKKKNSSRNFPKTKEKADTVLESDNKNKIYNENKQSDISIEQHVNKKSVSEFNTIEIPKIPELFDDLFDKHKEDDTLSEYKGSFDTDKTSLKSSNNEIGTNDVYIHIKKHVENSNLENSVRGLDENSVSLYNDISRNQEISNMLFLDKKTDDILKNIHKSKSLENYLNAEPVDGVLFDTECLPSVEKNGPEIRNTSTYKVDLGDDSSVEPSENKKKSTSIFDDLCHEEDEYKQPGLPVKMQDADIDDFINREYVISDNVNVEKRVSFDKTVVVNENNSREQSLYQEESNEMQNNISKIAERLQQISNKQQDASKLAVVPGKLSHKFNINVGALLPGSAPPRREKILASNPKTAEASNEEPDFLRNPSPILRTQSETHSIAREYKLEKSVSFDNVADVEVLQSVTKHRPKIPVKRRPSSRKARQQSLRDSLPDDLTLSEKHNVKDSPQEKSNQSKSSLTPLESKTDINPQNENIQNLEILSTKNLEHSLKMKKEISDKPASSILKELNLSEQKKSITLFDDVEDDTDDLFKTTHTNIRNINQSKKEDLFGKMPSEKKELVFAKTTSFRSDMNAEVDKLFDSDDNKCLENNGKTSDSSMKDHTTKKEKQFASTIDNISEKSSSSKMNDENVKSPKTSLFGSSDEDDDFLKSLSKPKIAKPEKNSNKTISNTKIGSKLFNDDEDILGEVSSSKSKTAKHDIEPSVINKKTPNSSSVRKLENVEGNEDPLSAMLK